MSLQHLHLIDRNTQKAYLFFPPLFNLLTLTTAPTPTICSGLTSFYTIMQDITRRYLIIQQTATRHFSGSDSFRQVKPIPSRAHSSPLRIPSHHNTREEPSCHDISSKHLKGRSQVRESIIKAPPQACKPVS